MAKLADFTLVEPIFRECGITPNWLHALAHGETTLYGTYGIVNHYYYDGFCVINSGTIGNERFTKSMVREILTLIKDNNKVIMSSNVESIGRFLGKHNMRYDSTNRAYIKGV